MIKTVFIGIDPGVKTGIAIVDGSTGELLEIESGGILSAMDVVLKIKEIAKEVEVFIENPGDRSWFGNTGRERLQGAGSIKRDYSIWEEFFERHRIKYTSVAPKNNRTKMKASTFRNLTKWKKQTNQHSRDAAMLVFGKRAAPEGFRKMNWGPEKTTEIDVGGVPLKVTMSKNLPPMGIEIKQTKKK